MFFSGGEEGSGEDKDLGYLPEDQHKDLSAEVVEIRRMLLAFNKKLRS